MSQIKIRRAHNLTNEQVSQKLDALAKNPASQHVRWKRQGDKLLLEGASSATKGCSGEVVLGPNYVEVTLKLSFMAALFKDKVEKTLCEELDALLK